MATVNGDVAMNYVREFVALGARPGGTTESRAAAEWIARKARDMGYEVDILEVRADTPLGARVFSNVRAVRKGRGNRFLIAGSHLDTKILPDVPNFEGANDSGSSTGLLLAVMEQIAAIKPWNGCTVEFLFFDGEEAFVKYDASDGLYGSRRYAAELVRDDRIRACAAMLLLDMIGDRQLYVTFPRSNDKELVSKAFTIAESLGLRDYFGYYLRHDILDDHVPFQRLGVPCILFIDFEYGPSNSYWHTAEDTMDKIAPASLEIVGNVFINLLLELARR